MIASLCYHVLYNVIWKKRLILLFNLQNDERFFVIKGCFSVICKTWIITQSSSYEIFDWYTVLANKMKWKHIVYSLLSINKIRTLWGVTGNWKSFFFLLHYTLSTPWLKIVYLMNKRRSHNKKLKMSLLKCILSHHHHVEHRSLENKWIPRTTSKCPQYLLRQKWWWWW